MKRVRREVVEVQVDVVLVRPHAAALTDLTEKEDTFALYMDYLSLLRAQ